MPFTFSHPAAVLPISKVAKKTEYMNLTALVLGSMAPDFQYFIHFRPYGGIGHTWPGQLIYNLPLVVIVALIFHRLVKKQAISHLPTFLYKRFRYLLIDNFRISSVKEVLAFVYCSLIGGATHLLWDGFTHEGAFFVRRMSLLTETLNIMGRHIHLYKIAQHGSTLLGGMVIFLYLYKESGQYKSIKGQLSLLEPEATIRRKVEYWSIVFIVEAIFILSYVSLLQNIQLGSLVITCLNGVIGGIILASLYTKLTGAKKFVKIYKNKG